MVQTLQVHRRILGLAVMAAVLLSAVPRPAAAGHGAASYDNQLKAAEKSKPKKQAAPAAPEAAPTAAEQAAAASADPDHAFATALRRHLEVEARIARDEIDRGKDPAMQALARRILAMHRDEIIELDRWLTENPIDRR